MLPFLLMLFLGDPKSLANSIQTNSVAFEQAPDWVKQSRVERLIDRVQNRLEWDIRKIRGFWYPSAEAFQKAHGFDASVLAFTRKTDMTLHFGPRVVDSNFDGVFQHELVHVILAQKYRAAIPAWLEEGTANYHSDRGKVDYAWLASQPARDVTTLVHPFLAPGKKAPSSEDSRYHYQASTALIEMIASRCDLSELFQLSVQKGLEKYLSTFCSISDVNAEFKAWLKRKAPAQKTPQPSPSPRIK